MNTIDLHVEDRRCGGCVRPVIQALQPLPGVSGVEVDLQSGRVRVSGELAQGGDPLVMALTGAGYLARPAAAASTSTATTKPKA